MYKYIQDSVKEFEKGNYKYLFTSIVPGVSHLCGKAIKKKEFGCKGCMMADTCGGVCDEKEAE